MPTTPATLPNADVTARRRREPVTRSRGRIRIWTSSGRKRRIFGVYAPRVLCVSVARFGCWHPRVWIGYAESAALFISRQSAWNTPPLHVFICSVVVVFAVTLILLPFPIPRAVGVLLIFFRVYASSLDSSLKKRTIKLNETDAGTGGKRWVTFRML